jgi:hypothetical protein
MAVGSARTAKSIQAVAATPTAAAIPSSSVSKPAEDVAAIPSAEGSQSVAATSNAANEFSAEARELVFLSNLRRRFLPSLSSSCAADSAQEEQARNVLHGHGSALVAGDTPSPRPAALEPASPSPSVASPLASSASASAASPSASGTVNEHAPVTSLRDFTPRELVLASEGWREFHASRSKWSQISSKYLPAWPRKLLAKAWQKHSEKTVRCMISLPVSKMGRPRGSTSEAKAKKPIEEAVEVMSSMDDEEESTAGPSGPAAPVSIHLSTPIATPMPPAASLTPLRLQSFRSPAARVMRNQPWQRLEYETMEDEEDEDENAAPQIVESNAPKASQYVISTVASPASTGAAASGPTSSAAPLPALLPSFTPAKPNVAGVHQAAA